MTGSRYLSFLQQHGVVIKFGSCPCYISDWRDLNHLNQSETANIFYTGTRLGDDLVVYHTFSCYPSGEQFEPFGLAIQK